MAHTAVSTRKWRRVAALAPALAFAIPALACGTPSGSGTAQSLVELQSGLSVGHAPEWYTQKLDELGYQVASLRYDGDDRLEYRIEKDAAQFVVRVTLDPEQGTGNRVEIDPGGGAMAASTESAPGADLSTAASAERAPRTAPAETAPEPALRFVSVPSGTRIAAKLNDYLDSGESRTGDRFTMTVSEPVVIAGIEAIPAGALVQGVVAEAESARRPNKGGLLVLKAERIDVRGGQVPVEALVTAEARELEGEGSIRDDLKEIAVGAGIGGLVGGLIGGGKGVLAGVLIGGGGTFAATKGEQVELPPDTPLLVELRREASFAVSR